MDPSLNLAFDELLRKFEEIEARWEQRLSESRAAQERRGAAREPGVDIPERTPAAQLDAVVVADNWGGLFEPVSLPVERVVDSMKEQLAVVAHVVADNWGGLFIDVPVPALDSTSFDPNAFNYDTASTKSDTHPVALALDTTHTEKIEPGEFPLKIQERVELEVDEKVLASIGQIRSNSSLTVEREKVQIEAHPLSFVVQLEQDVVQLEQDGRAPLRPHRLRPPWRAPPRRHRPRHAPLRPPRLRRPRRTPPRPPWRCRSLRAHRRPPLLRRPRRAPPRPPWRCRSRRAHRRLPRLRRPRRAPPRPPWPRRPRCTPRRPPWPRQPRRVPPRPPASLTRVFLGESDPRASPPRSCPLSATAASSSWPPRAIGTPARPPRMLSSAAIPLRAITEVLRPHHAASSDMLVTFSTCSSTACNTLAFVPSSVFAMAIQRVRVLASQVPVGTKRLGGLGAFLLAGVVFATGGEPSFHILCYDVTTAAGVDRVHLDRCARRGSVVTGVCEIFSVDIAIPTVKLLGGRLRHIAAVVRCFHAGLWPEQGNSPEASYPSTLRLLQLVVPEEEAELPSTLHNKCSMNGLILMQLCFSLPSCCLWEAVLHRQRTQWPPPTKLWFVSFDAGLRPLPWPSFNMVEWNSATCHFGRLWKPPWFATVIIASKLSSTSVNAQVEFAEIQQRYITNLISASWLGVVLSSSSKLNDQMVLEGISAQNTMLLESLLAAEMSILACLHFWQQFEAMLLCWKVEHTGCSWEFSVHKLIRYLARCLFNLAKWIQFLERVSLLQKVHHYFALANNLKVDLFRSSQCDSISLLFLLRNSSANASLLVVGTLSWRAQNLLLHEKIVVEVAHIDMTTWFNYHLVSVLVFSKQLATTGSLKIELNWYFTRCTEFQPWPPPAILHTDIDSEFIETLSVGLMLNVLNPVTSVASDLIELGYDELQFGQHTNHDVRYTDQTWLDCKMTSLPFCGRHLATSFMEFICPTHTRTYNMMVTAELLDWKLSKVMSDTQVWCQGELLFSIQVLQVPWDPGGSEIVHRLGGKPQLKKGGMSGSAHGWAVIWAMGLGLVEQPLPVGAPSIVYKSTGAAA